MIGSSIASDLGEFTEGAKVDIDAGVKDGYTFTGWTSNNAITLNDPAGIQTFFEMIAEAVTVTANWLATHGTRLSVCKIAIETSLESTEWKWNSIVDDLRSIINDTITDTDTEIVFVMDDANTVTTASTNLEVGSIAYGLDLKLGEDVLHMSGSVTLPIVPASEWAFTCTVIGSNAEVTGAGKYKGSTVVDLDAGTIIGKTFKQWTTENPDVTFVNSNDATTQITMPLSDVSVTATWDEINYTITMDESCDTAKGPDANYNYGETVTITCTNSDFVEWSCDDPTVVFADKTNPETTFTMPAKNISIDHSFKSYNVNITGEFATTGSGSYLAGQTVIVKTESIPEYTFNGWTSDEATFTQVNEFESTFVMPSKDVNVSATWTRIVYDVTVTLMDLKSTGYEPISEIIVSDIASGDLVELNMLPGNHLDGYKFIECVPVSDNLPSEDLGQTPTFTMPSGNVTLNYKRNPQLTLEIHGVNGSATPETKTVYTGDVVQLDAGLKTGATFSNWTVEPADSATIANANDAATSITMINHSAKVSVVWNMISYSITVDDECNSLSKKDNVHYGETITVTCNSSEFVEWSCSDPSVVFADKTAASTTFQMPANNISIDHTFKTHTVTIVDGGIGALGAGSYLAGATVTINAGTMKGHSFQGWDMSGPVEIDSNTSETHFIMPSADITATAGWITNDYQVSIEVQDQQTDGSYAINAGAGINVGNKNFESEVELKYSQVQQAGYRFIGWEVKSGEVTLNNPATETTKFTMNDKPVVVICKRSNVYQVTVNNGNGSSEVKTARSGDTVSIDAGTKEGYVFTGWNNDGSVTLANSALAQTTFTMPAKNFTVTGTWNTYFKADPSGNIGVSDYYKGLGNNAPTQLIIPSNMDGIVIKRIAITGFQLCNKLTSVTIPTGVESIDNAAFDRCTALTTVSISNTVKRIGASAFTGCSSLKTIVIPNSVTDIGNQAFNECIELTNVTLPNTITTLNLELFKFCSKLTSITIPDSVTSIANGVFCDCALLTSINISANVTSIGSYVFQRCSALTAVNINKNSGSIAGSPWGANASAIKWAKYQVTLTGVGTGSSGNGFYAPGTTVSINAGTYAAPKYFERWTGMPVAGSGSATNAQTTFVMPANDITITATTVDMYNLSVKGSNLPDAMNGSGKYSPSATAIVKAGTPAAGKSFVGWKCNSGNVTLAGGSGGSGSGNLPANIISGNSIASIRISSDSEVEAVWVDLYSVNVTGSNLPNDQNGSGQYAPGTTVTVNAGTPAAGMKFVGWECSTNNVTPI